MATAILFHCIILIIAICNSASESTLPDDKVPVEFLGKTYYVHTNIPKSDRLNTSELVRASGYDCEEVDVTTEDGYILKLFHILANNGSQDPPILLMHGLMDSSDTFCIRRKNSLPINLVESGYDVWLPNMRGNRYSRSHIKYDPDKDKKYWDFSFHENGYYDFPACIDKVLEITGKSQVIIISHSQGPLNYLVMGSTRPDYNDKVKVSIAMAPIWYSQHMRSISQFGPPFLPLLLDAFALTGEVELLNQNNTLRLIIQDFCTGLKEVSYKLCLDGIILPVLGYDPEQIEPEFVPVMMSSYFAGSSVKTAAHFSQFINDRKYSEYDYGAKENNKIYGSSEAPLYNLTNVSSKVVLMVGKNDYCSTIKDGIMLNNSLPNSTYFEMPMDKFSHIDFVWGSKMKKYNFPYIHKFLNEYK